jgi:hypothetical protein
VGAPAGDEAAHAALNTRLQTRNILRMRRYPHRIVLGLTDSEPSPTRGNSSITLVTPLSEEPALIRSYAKSHIARRSVNARPLRL